MDSRILLRHPGPGSGAHGRLRRNRKRQPRIPARGPICRIEFPVSLQVQVTLQTAAEWKNISDLRAHTEDARPEASEYRSSAPIIGDLLIGVTDKTNEDL